VHMLLSVVPCPPAALRGKLEARLVERKTIGDRDSDVNNHARSALDLWRRNRRSGNAYLDSRAFLYILD
jgi:hypothetical protein